MQIKQIDCKMSTKNVTNYKWKTFLDTFGQLHTQEYKATKKQIVRFQPNEKKSKEWVDTENASQPKGWTWWHITVILGLCFLLIDWLSFGEVGGGSFEILRPRSKGWKDFGCRRTRALGGGGGLEDCSIFMDVICVSSLTELILKT